MVTYGVNMNVNGSLSLYADPRDLSGCTLAAGTGSRTPPLFLVIPVKGRVV